MTLQFSKSELFFVWQHDAHRATTKTFKGTVVAADGREAMRQAMQRLGAKCQIRRAKWYGVVRL